MSTEAQTKLDDAARKLKLPTSQYKLRVIAAERIESMEKKTPGIALVCEIFDKPPISGVDVNGLQLRTTSWLSLKGINFVNEIRSALGLPLVTEETFHTIDEKDYVRCEGIAKCSGSSEPQLDEQTGEQMKDPYSGEELFTTKREIKNWYPRPDFKRV